MNISPTNNSQPSFRGVIAPAVDIYRRPMPSIIFRVVPDTKLKGIQMGEKIIESESADLLTKFVADLHSMIECKRAQVKANPSAYKRFRGLSLRPYVNRIINELGLSHDDRNALFNFIKKKEMTVQKAKQAGEFEVSFERPIQKPFTPDRHVEKWVD